MTKQELCKSLSDLLVDIGEKGFKAIEQFPDDIWDDRHILKLVNKLVENRRLSTEQLIKKIKIADPVKKWYQDRGEKYTFQEEVKK